MKLSEAKAMGLQTLTEILASHVKTGPKDPDFEKKVKALADTNPVVKQIQSLREQMTETARAEYFKAKAEVTELFRKLAHSFTDLIHFASEAGEDTKNLEKVQSQLVKLKTQASLEVTGLGSENKASETEEQTENPEETSPENSGAPAPSDKADQGEKKPEFA